MRRTAGRGAAGTTSRPSGTSDDKSSHSKACACFSLLSRMELPVDIAQPTARDVGINFRGADVGVAEQFLDDAQVCAVFQQMRGEAVSQHVRSDVPAHAA